MEKSEREYIALRRTCADGLKVWDIRAQSHMLTPVRQEVSDPGAGESRHIQQGELVVQDWMANFNNGAFHTPQKMYSLKNTCTKSKNFCVPDFTGMSLQDLTHYNRNCCNVFIVSIILHGSKNVFCPNRRPKIQGLKRLLFFKQAVLDCWNHHTLISRHLFSNFTKWSSTTLKSNWPGVKRWESRQDLSNQWNLV